MNFKIFSVVVRHEIVIKVAVCLQSDKIRIYGVRLFLLWFTEKNKNYVTNV